TDLRAQSSVESVSALRLLAMSSKPLAFGGSEQWLRSLVFCVSRREQGRKGPAIAPFRPWVRLPSDPRQRVIIRRCLVSPAFGAPAPGFPEHSSWVRTVG